MAGVDPMKSKFGYNPQSDTYDELCDTYGRRKNKLDKELALPAAQQDKEKIQKLREITKNLEQTIAKGGYKIVGTKDVASGMMKYSLEKVH